MVAGNDDPGRNGNGRQYERGDVRILAEIRESGAGKQRVSVLDLSPSGFRMHCIFYIPEDRTVFLTMPGFAPLEAMIAWHRGDYYGCRFAQPLYQAVYDHIVKQFPSLGDRL